MKATILFASSALALSFCNTECNTVTTLLSTCQLPELSPTFQLEGPPAPQLRNVTNSGYDMMPSTFFIPSLLSASCFCTDGRLELAPCKKCLNDDWLSKNQDIQGIPINGEWNTVSAYERDCRKFGYYANETMAYPSTTETSPPRSTRTPNVRLLSQNVQPAQKSCRDNLAIVEGQIDECGLTPLEVKRAPDSVGIEIGKDLNFYGKVLFNRTAGECVCTLPVLRRLQTVRACVVGEPEHMLDAYETDCANLGYFPDDKLVELVAPQVTTTTSTIAAASASHTPIHGAAERSWVLQSGLLGLGLLLV